MHACMILLGDYIVCLLLKFSFSLHACIYILEFAVPRSAYTYMCLFCIYDLCLRIYWDFVLNLIYLGVFLPLKFQILSLN